MASGANKSAKQAAASAWPVRADHIGRVRLFATDRLDSHAGALLSGLVALTALGVAFLLDPFLDGDTGWHLGAGRWIAEHRTVPLTDPFSHSFAGTPWTAHEWLAEILMAGAEAAAGWAGLAALFAAAGAATLWMIGREAFRWLPARWALAFSFACGGLLLPFMLARPHMLAWPLLAAWTLILLRARARSAAPPALAGLLMLVWANLHASYIIAFGLAGLFGLEALLERPRDRAQFLGWVRFGLIAAAAALVTPLGPSHLVYPFMVSGMEALAVIGEWRRSLPLDEPLFYALAAGLALHLWQRRSGIPPLRILLLIGLTVMAVMHARHQMLFAIVGGLVVLPTLRGEAQPLRAEVPAAGWLLPLLGALLLLRLIIPYRFVESPAYPLSLIDSIPAETRALPVFNEYSQGGPLVMRGVRPFIDGRADMYGDAFTLRARRIVLGDIAAFREDAARYRIGWVLLGRDNPLVDLLRREPGWRVLAEDRHAVAFTRS